MIQSRFVRWSGVGLLLLAVVLVIGAPLPSDPQAQAQPGQAEFTDGLRFVPADAALFVYADVPKVWDSSVLKSMRKADPKTFEFLTDGVKKELGISPEDVKSVVVFVPKLKGPSDTESLGIAVTFSKPFDKAQIEKGAEKLLPKNAKVKIVVPDARTALVLVNLKEDEFGKPRAAKQGPLTDALKAAGSGKYAAVAGATLANLPDELRGDNIPAPFRTFQPLFQAVTISATLDLDRDPTLDVRVKAGTARQARDCEKSLAALLAMIQDEFESGLKDAEKDAGLKDLVVFMKAVGTAAKSAKFSTLGGEAQLTVSLPGDLPFAGAYLGLRKKSQEVAATAAAANNLKQIGLAMHNYHDANMGFPPAAACDKTGKPLLSWRVLVLPYIEEDALFKEFKLDEPWDSVNNKKLLAKMPKVYAIPGKTQLGDTETHYRVFVGNGAVFDYVKSSNLTQISDGTSNTLMVVTAAEAVPWTKPEELAFDPDKDPSKLFAVSPKGKVQVGMCDGSVRTMKKLPSKETLKALITSAGGEVLGTDAD
ncbi:MAG: DUF1559 domain-containing protein [Planctomycetes bacterium]|nr:DUF1559 domain-containing protein [Planctomycetota bacterium]